MKNKRFFYIALVFLIALVSFVVFVEIQFNTLEQKPFIQDAQKNWSHRGFARTEVKENTLEAITLAFQNGYKGVEIDLWYKDGKFYLIHDENYADSLPKLSTVFHRFPDSYFWLDLKNLSYSNHKAISHQLGILKKNKKSYLIESKNGFPLGLLHKKGFQTSFWLTKGNFIRQFIQKSCIVLFKYNGISMPARTYQKKNVRKKYKHLNIHLWDKRPGSQLYQWEEVKIVLDDNELN